MCLCIFFCLVNFIISFTIKEVENIKPKSDVKTAKFSFKVDKIVLLLFIAYVLFLGLIVMGSNNGKLLIQYELLDFYNSEKTVIYFTTILAISRIVRIGANVFFSKIYYKHRDKVSIFLGLMPLLTFVFLSVGYFINFNLLLKFSCMAIGFFFILMSRDPFTIYIKDTLLKNVEPAKHQSVMAYLGFIKQLSIAILSLTVSALLIKIEMIYIIIMFIFIGFLEFLIILKLYKMLKQDFNNKTDNN
jgi:hypothetical protein